MYWCHVHTAHSWWWKILLDVMLSSQGQCSSFEFHAGSSHFQPSSPSLCEVLMCSVARYTWDCFTKQTSVAMSRLSAAAELKMMLTSSGRPVTDKMWLCENYSLSPCRLLYDQKWNWGGGGGNCSCWKSEIKQQMLATLSTCRKGNN